ncbi:uncharacterized protein PSANT_06284 [Moesziomyces antarcticus]|uniref:Uncharacterized protein n=1 Tax=Pseudozyma antarctica TaxID=84753 RepID=A0A5C3FVZ4_PSEA2|nr:uncharacterized protein PSANT_06284 [Moesziomyces antarcticus]
MKPRPGTKPFAGLRLPGFMPAFGGCSSNEAAAMRSPARPFDRSSVPHHRHSGPPVRQTQARLDDRCDTTASPRPGTPEAVPHDAGHTAHQIAKTCKRRATEAASVRRVWGARQGARSQNTLFHLDVPRGPVRTMQSRDGTSAAHLQRPFRPPSARLDLRAPRAWSPPYRHIRLLRIHDCGHFHSIEAFPRPARPLLPTHPGTSHSGKLLNLVLRAPQPERARSGLAPRGVVASYRRYPRSSTDDRTSSQDHGIVSRIHFLHPRCRRVTRPHPILTSSVLA